MCAPRDNNAGRERFRDRRSGKRLPNVTDAHGQHMLTGLRSERPDRSMRKRAIGSERAHGPSTFCHRPVDDNRTRGVRETVRGAHYDRINIRSHKSDSTVARKSHELRRWASEGSGAELDRCV